MPSFSPENISIQILNGARLWGVAGSWEEKFINAGFRNIEIGSAPGDEIYTGIEIRYRPSHYVAVPLIKDVLQFGGIAPDAIRETKGLEEGEYDFIIVVGR